MKYGPVVSFDLGCQVVYKRLFLSTSQNQNAQLYEHNNHRLISRYRLVVRFISL